MPTSGHLLATLRFFIKSVKVKKKKKKEEKERKEKIWKFAAASADLLL